MKTNSIILSLIACCLSTLALAQVEINKNLQMTGGTNADRLITNVGDPSTAAGAVNVQSLQKGTLIYAVTGGTANAITATTTPSFTPQAGSTICFKAAATNTGAVTLNVNGSGAFNLLRGNTALVAGDIQANQLITATYDGTTWQATGGVGDNLGNHQATQTITANANDVYDIGNSTNGFKDLYLTGSLKLDNTVFVNNLGGSTLLGETQNTAISGAANVLIGYQAGKSTTTGTSNVFIGNTAGQATMTGNKNVFIGKDAGYNSLGDEAVLIGYQAGYTQSTNAFKNIFIGYQAGYTINSSDNLFIGHSVSRAMLTGFRNTNVGIFANRFGTKGSDNVFIGFNTADNTEGSLNVYIGSRAVQTGSLSDSNNVVIGALAGNAIGNNGKKNIIIGSQSDLSTTSLQNASVIGYSARVSKSNTMVFGNTKVAAWLFGVADVDTTTRAFVVGSNAYNGNGAYLTKGGAWTNTSDKNKKENFILVNAQEILDKIASLPITQWNYKGESPSIKHIGPMAQDFYQIFKLGTDDKSISTLDPAGIALVAIQELYKKDQTIEKQLEEINKLKADIGKLQSHLDLIKVENQTMNQEIAEIKTLLKKSSSVAVKE